MNSFPAPSSRPPPPAPFPLQFSNGVLIFEPYFPVHFVHKGQNTFV